MALADTLARSGIPFPVAVEIARQINIGAPAGGSVDGLMTSGIPLGQAVELSSQINAGVYSPSRLVAAGWPVAVARTFDFSVAEIRAQLISRLVSAGVWSKLDSLFLLAAPDTATALVDMVQTSRTATVSGSPTFTANKGYTGNGSSAYIDTGYNPAVNAVNLTQNSNSFGVWSLTAVADGAGVYDFGQTNYAVAPFSLSVAAFASRNASTSVPVVNIAGQPGFYTSRRNASGGYNIDYNGGTLFAATSNSQGLNIGAGGTEVQGWCTDGSFYYVADTQALRKLALADWSLVASNSNIFSTTTGGVNHTGDFATAGGLLYVPLSKWSGSCGGDNSTATYIGVYNCSDLSLVAVHRLIGTNTLSAIALDSVNNIIYGVDYCDPTILYRFSMTTFETLSPVTISVPMTGFQGLAYNNGVLYISGVNSAASTIMMVGIDGKYLGSIRLTDLPANIEGVSFSGSSLGVNYDDGVGTAKVYFYTPPTLGTTNSSATASTSINSETFTLFKRNGASAFSSNQLAMSFVGSYLTDTELRSFYRAVKTYLVGVRAI